MCTISLRFQLDKRGFKKEDKLVIGRVYCQGKQKTINTMVRVTEEEWDNDRGMPINRSSQETSDLNRVHTIVTKDIFNSLSEKFERPPTAAEVCESFSRKTKRPIKRDYNATDQYIRDYVETKRPMYSAGRINTYTVLAKLVVLYSDKHKASLVVNDIDRAWIDKFINFMCYEEYKEEGKFRYKNSTTIMYIKALYSVMNFYNRKPRFTVNDVVKYIRKQSKDVTGKYYITFDEVVDIYKFEIKKYKHRMARDLFVLCCFTGMRHNESQSIRWQNIRKGENGVKVLKYYASKNDSYVTVPLNDICLEIMNKYCRDKMRGPIMPPISSSVAGSYLRKVLTDFGMTDVSIKVSYSGKDRIEEEKTIAEMVTFHSSRHTFACNMLNKGMTFQEVSDLIGISVLTLMKWYSKSMEDMRMSKASNILQCFK